MKRVFLFAVVALVMSATTFAGNKEKSNEWNISVNVNQLGKYLELSGEQYGEVKTITDFFSSKMKDAANTSNGKKSQKVREAVYGNFKLMKNTLNEEQYRKYVRLMNITLKHKGLDIYLSEE